MIQAVGLQVPVNEFMRAEWQKEGGFDELERLAEEYQFNFSFFHVSVENDTVSDEISITISGVSCAFTFVHVDPKRGGAHWMHLKR